MKNFTAFFLLTLIIGHTSLFAQGGKIESANNVSKMLCKSWVPIYSTVNGKREEATDTKGMTFKFKADNSFVMLIYFPNTSVFGTWKYDPAKKAVVCTIKHFGQDPTVFYIVSLSDTELKEATAYSDGSGEKFIYTVYNPIK